MENDNKEFGDNAGKNPASHANSQENKGEFGDFKEVKEEEKPAVAKPGVQGKKPAKKQGKKPWQKQGEEAPSRVRLPRGREVIGMVVQRYGGNKMEVRGSDGKTRNGRVPGRYKRRMWLRPGDFVIIEPWEDDDEKADIVFQYRGGQVNQLRKRGLLEGLQNEF
jgi:translation initiation factor 1A